MPLDDALEQQTRLKDDVDIFKEYRKPKESVKKEKRALTIKNTIIILKGREKVVNAFQSEIFPKLKQGKGLKRITDRKAKVSNLKVLNHKQLKLLTLKQMLQRLPTALAQVKAGNKSETLLNEISQIIYSLY